MAERDKAKDRPSGHQSSSSGSGAYSFLPAIFGRRPTPAPPSTSRAHATYDGKPHNERSTHRDPLEEMISPKGKLATLPVAAATATRESSPRPFHLDSAIALMKDGTESTAELCEIVKATAVWMANLLVGNEDIFSTQVEATTVKAEDITTLYGLATNFADPKADPALRVAAIRLLAALIATAPPSLQSPLDGSGQNIRTLYSLIICPSAPTDPPSIANAVFVEVGALKALTQDGVYVSQLEGLVGWLVRSLEELQEEWVVWCCQKSDRSQDWGSDAVRRVSRRRESISRNADARADSAVHPHHPRHSRRSSIKHYRTHHIYHFESRVFVFPFRSTPNHSTYARLLVCRCGSACVQLRRQTAADLGRKCVTPRFPSSFHSQFPYPAAQFYDRFRSSGSGGYRPTVRVDWQRFSPRYNIYSRNARPSSRCQAAFSRISRPVFTRST